jgi:hypothetical protein
VCLVTMAEAALAAAMASDGDEGGGTDSTRLNVRETYGNFVLNVKVLASEGAFEFFS